MSKRPKKCVQSGKICKGQVRIESLALFDENKGIQTQLRNWSQANGECGSEADFISGWFSGTDSKFAQVLIPCAMLLRLGMILFSNTLVQSGKDKEFLAMLKECDFKDVATVEVEFYGLDHLTFLGFLFDHWKFDEVLIQTTAYITMPHAASDEVKKNAYALAIVNKVFEPYRGGDETNMQEAIALIKEAETQGIIFDMERFLRIAELRKVQVYFPSFFIVQG